MNNIPTDKYAEEDRLLRLKHTEEYYDKVFKILEPLDLVDSYRTRKIETLLKENHIELNYQDYLLRKEI